MQSAEYYVNLPNDLVMRGDGMLYNVRKPEFSQLSVEFRQLMELIVCVYRRATVILCTS